MTNSVYVGQAEESHVAVADSVVSADVFLGQQPAGEFRGHNTQLMVILVLVSAVAEDDAVSSRVPRRTADLRAVARFASVVQ